MLCYFMLEVLIALWHFRLHRGMGGKGQVPESRAPDDKVRDYQSCFFSKRHF